MSKTDPIKQCDYCKQFVDRDTLVVRGTFLDPMLACKTHPGCGKHATWADRDVFIDLGLIVDDESAESADDETNGNQ